METTSGTETKVDNQNTSEESHDDGREWQLTKPKKPHNHERKQKGRAR